MMENNVAEQEKGVKIKQRENYWLFFKNLTDTHFDILRICYVAISENQFI